MEHKKILEQNKNSWDKNSKNFFGTTALPQYGCNIPTETELNLIGDVSQKRTLEIGCGSGHSMLYLAEKGAKEVWGLDISEKQKEAAAHILSNQTCITKVLVSPMEEDPRIPHGYFDVVYSIYALGWTVDLNKTLENISNYLKKDGIFIFSWDHPFMHCVDEEERKLIFSGTYHDEDLFSFTKEDATLSLRNRKFSTYVNSLYEAGFIIERIVEEVNDTEKDVEFASSYYSKKKLKHFPLSFIIKARKL